MRNIASGECFQVQHHINFVFMFLLWFVKTYHVTIKLFHSVTLVHASLLSISKIKLYLFYNDYETSYTTYINHDFGTDVCVCVVFVWEETIVPGGKLICLT